METDNEKQDGGQPSATTTCSASLMPERDDLWAKHEGLTPALAAELLQFSGRLEIERNDKQRQIEAHVDALHELRHRMEKLANAWDDLGNSYGDTCRDAKDEADYEMYHDLDGRRHALWDCATELRRICEPNGALSGPTKEDETKGTK